MRSTRLFTKWLTEDLCGLLVLGSIVYPSLPIRNQHRFNPIVLTMTTQQTRQSISLKGSTKIVTEFFEYSVNSILYQRNVYPADDFRMVKKYGLPMLITSDESLKAYLDTILKQVHGESSQIDGLAT